jgi:N-acetylmuramic acid 6-phosphate etherase
MSRPTSRRAPDPEVLATEAWDVGAMDLDLRTTEELVMHMNAADTGVPAAVAAARTSIAAAVDLVAGRLRAGGRLIYAGAGTSGSLAAVDATECEATFGVPPGVVVALVAGEADATVPARQEAEDDRDAGILAARELVLDERDIVVGLSASGRTPFTCGVLAEARSAGASTVAVVSAPRSELASLGDVEICVDVGPEVISGSTRLKAGTAQKLVLNMLSTIAMVRLGKTYGNLMVDVVASNDKLRARVRRIVAQATGADETQVEAALVAAGGDARVAIVALGAGVDVEVARARLEASGGVVREALAG